MKFFHIATGQLVEVFGIYPLSHLFPFEDESDPEGQVFVVATDKGIFTSCQFFLNFRELPSITFYETTSGHMIPLVEQIVKDVLPCEESKEGFSKSITVYGRKEHISWLVKELTNKAKSFNNSSHEEIPAIRGMLRENIAMAATNAEVCRKRKGEIHERGE